MYEGAPQVLVVAPEQLAVSVLAIQYHLVPLFCNTFDHPKHQQP
jgi:hypothetical protein